MARTRRPPAGKGEDGGAGALPLRRRPAERQPPGRTCWAASKQAASVGNLAPSASRAWVIRAFTSSAAALDAGFSHMHV